jgi:hypothetical protein
MAPESERTSFAGVRTLGVNSDAGTGLGKIPPVDAASRCVVDLDSPCEASAQQIRRWVSDAPRWLLLVVLVSAPWVYGCTRSWTLPFLNGVLLSVVGLWFVACLVRRSPPRIQPVLVITSALLLVQGWWMTLNSQWNYDAQFKPHPREPFLGFPTLPGSIDFSLSLPAMIGLSGMLGVACFVCDLARRPRWRQRIWLTMALTGVSVVLLGLVQKVTRAPGIFWQAEGHGLTFFGTYRYHANAGAFINIIWPLVGAFLLNAIRQHRSRRQIIFWASCLILCITGALANTSRASALIAVVTLTACAVWQGIMFVQRRSESIHPAIGMAIALSLAALVMIVVAVGGLDATLGRWRQVDREFSTKNSRLVVAQVCLKMLPHSGWLGFGPGTFPTAFPFFNQDTTASTRGVWLEAHQDYLQTLVEWGWVGAGCWGVVVFGALAFALTSKWRRRTPSSRSDRLITAAACVGLSTALVHALGDFPLQIASLQLYVAVVSGMLWGETAGRRGSEEPISA